MSEFITLLNHGHVGLVEHMGTDLAISRAARVSYNAEPREEDAGLIRYLMKNKHTSPFEAVVFTFDVKAPIFVYRQWHRHRTWSYNELSARYKELPNEWYVPLAKTIGIQSETNKQARIIDGSTEASLKMAAMQLQIDSACDHAFKVYEALLADGCPREVARVVLPLATYSHMFATVDLHNLFHFIRLRADSHSQWEIQQYAKAMLELITPIVPNAVEAFKSSL